MTEFKEGFLLFAFSNEGLDNLDSLLLRTTRKSCMCVGGGG